MDSWSESETLVFFNERSSSVHFLFFYFRAFLTCFYTIIFISCLVNLFFLSKCLLFFYFAYLNSALRVVHWSVVCPQVPWYLKNFFPVCPLSESSLLESSKAINFLFLELFLFFLLFLERTQGRIDFSYFLILVLKNSAIEWMGPSK